MKRIISVFLALAFTLSIFALPSCNYWTKEPDSSGDTIPENVTKIEEIIKAGMKNNGGRYYLGSPYGNMHSAEIRINGDGIDIAIYTPVYSSHIIQAEDFEIYVVDELTPYCQKLYFEYEETTYADYWETSDSFPKDGLGHIMFLTGKIYYISPETDEKIELNLR